MSTTPMAVLPSAYGTRSKTCTPMSRVQSSSKRFNRPSSPFLLGSIIRTDVTSSTLSNVCHHGPWMVHGSSQVLQSRENGSSGAPPRRTRRCQMPLLLIVGLVVIGGLVLLLGGLVLLVVCSGINGLYDDTPRP